MNPSTTAATEFPCQRHGRGNCKARVQANPQKRESFALPAKLKAQETTQHPHQTAHSKEGVRDWSVTLCKDTRHLRDSTAKTALLKPPSFRHIPHDVSRELGKPCPIFCGTNIKVESGCFGPFTEERSGVPLFSIAQALRSLQPVRLHLKITLNQDVTWALSNAQLLTPTHGLSIFSPSTP